MQVTPVDPRPLMGREGNPAALVFFHSPQTISDLLNYMKDTDRMVAKLCDSDSDSTPPSKIRPPPPLIVLRTCVCLRSGCIGKTCVQRAGDIARCLSLIFNYKSYVHARCTELDLKPPESTVLHMLR